MVKFAFLGTCVGPDALRQAKDPDWKAGKALVSYSLSALVHAAGGERRRIGSVSFVGEKQDAKDLSAELNGDLLQVLQRDKFDLLLVDLCDFRITERVIELESGVKIYHTNRAYTAQSLENINAAVENAFGSRVKNITTVPAMRRPPQEVAKEIESLVRLLGDTFGPEKVLFYCSHPITQYLDKGEVKRTLAYKVSGNTNYWIEQVFDSVSSDTEYLPYPSNLIGDSGCISPFEFHYCKPYYEYLHEAIRLKLKNGRIGHAERAELLERCEEGIRRLYGEIACRALLAKIRPKSAAGQIQPVLIAKSRQFAELYEAEFGRRVYDIVHYDAQTDLEEVKQKICALKAKEPHCYFIVPELFYHGAGKGLPRVLYDADCLDGRDFSIYSPVRTVLDHYKGYYRDIYGNILYSQSEMTLVLNGGGNFVDIKTSLLKQASVYLYSNGTVEVGINSKGLNTKIQLWSCATFKAGSATNLNNANIACQVFSSMSIGNDCLFSFEEMVYAGDGHAIFELCDSKGTNRRLNPPENDNLTIGNHVWLGYRCHILPGSVIGDGSIVGAGSLVNKKFPNNCIIAGVPAKIIQKNRAWSAHPLYKDLQSDALAFENYAHLTEEGKNE